MVEPPDRSESVADILVAETRRRMAGHTRPFVIAIDGRSGSGKSTVAAEVARRLNATLVPTDDFFAAEITDKDWERRTPAQRAADALDWHRLRTEALEPLRSRRAARWRPFDFVAGAKADGTYALQAEPTERAPREVIILDGAYSARPELRDLIDLAVLVEAPEAIRHERLAAREEPGFLARWHGRWDSAEEHYFTVVRPPEAFDLAVTSGIP